MSMLERVLDTLSEVKSSSYDKAPPLHRLCWRLGILIPPPLLAPFWFNVILLGLVFGVTWGVMMTIFFIVRGSSWHYPWITVPLAAGAAGAFFGFFMATYAYRKGTRYKLPMWQSLVDAERNMR